MKVLIVIAALTILLTPVDGALRQCAGTGPGNRYESSGYLTADFTQNACAASGGSIDHFKKGNQKCCNVPDTRQGKFDLFCQRRTAGDNFPEFHPTAQPC
ncbi:hypothetical protein GN244_ATG00758 [Phytophthora infestans]|uniref:Uncharacterized protein n=1 Tax=Phytophthora infestans TaxID=4787 RepID=A0A833W8M7_PHYIN|nr:hypothetical protein GN244_ATG00758 [Phytophthora infestans]